MDGAEVRRTSGEGTCARLGLVAVTPLAAKGSDPVRLLALLDAVFASSTSSRPGCIDPSGVGVRGLMGLVGGGIPKV